MTDVLDAYRDDPVRFVEEVLGDKPYAKQREMLALLGAFRRVSVVGANGSGKDWAAARAILWWLATRLHAVVVVTGPTQRQVEEIVWRELRTAFKNARVPLGGRVTGSHWNIADDRYAIGFSTNKADNLQGFHSPELLVIVTEAHAMPQDQMEALKRLNPTRVLLTGNAFSRSGEFFDSHHTKRELYKCLAISAFDTPNFTGEFGGIPGMPTDEDIAERKIDWQEDHPLYQGSVLARFPDALDDSVLSRSAIEAAVQRWEQGEPSPATAWHPLPEGEGRGPGDPAADPPAGTPSPATAWHPLPGGEGRGPGASLPETPRPLGEGNAPQRVGEGAPPRPLGEGNAPQRVGEGAPYPPRPLGEGNTRQRVGEGSPYRLGVDVARFGSDKTALCLRRGWRVEALRSFSRIDTMRTAGEAAVIVRDHDVPAVFVDEGGLGAGVVDRLRELGVPVHGVQFGGKAPQSGRFANMRAEIFWELRRLFNDGLIAIPRDEELIGQLLGLRYDVTSSGQVRMESKSALRRRGLRSPDKADALALAFMEPPSLGIWTGPPTPATPGTSSVVPSSPVIPVPSSVIPVETGTHPRPVTRGTAPVIPAPAGNQSARAAHAGWGAVWGRPRPAWCRGIPRGCPVWRAAPPGPDVGAVREPPLHPADQRPRSRPAWCRGIPRGCPVRRGGVPHKHTGRVGGNNYVSLGQARRPHRERGSPPILIDTRALRW